MLRLYFVLISFLPLYANVASIASMESAAYQGCTIRYPNMSNFTVELTSSTVYSSLTYDNLDYCTDVDYSQTVYYDQEIDRVTAVTGCTLNTTTNSDGTTSISSTVVTSHINFTCGGCRAPQSSSGTTYQLVPTVAQSECTVQTLSTLYEQNNPNSDYIVDDAQWIDCFDEGSSQNGCYFNLVLNLPPDSNSTDNNTSSIEDGNSTNTNTGINTGSTSLNTSTIEMLLGDIKNNTANAALDLSAIKTNTEILADPDFDFQGWNNAYDTIANLEHNKTLFDMHTFIVNHGLDFNESNGSMFDTYKSAVEGFHNEVYKDLLDDNSTYGIKKLFHNVLLDVNSIGTDANPFVFFMEKGSNSDFPPIVLNYQNGTLDWLQFQITITADDLFFGAMAPFWYMIRLFLIFFAVFYGFTILIRGLNG